MTEPDTALGNAFAKLLQTYQDEIAELRKELAEVKNENRLLKERLLGKEDFIAD